MESQDKLGLRNTIISYNEMSNLVEEGEKCGHCFGTSKAFALYRDTLTDQLTL